jgi:outer membrane protein OmpA-like peptidoglycan-associated protein
MAFMRRNPLPALALLVAGCAALRPDGGGKTVLRAAELARVRCLLLAPLENASDAPLAADAATAALFAAIDPQRTQVMPTADLRALFRDTALELPPGIPPSLALELAGLVGADAALYGAVEGRAHDPGGEMLVTLRLALAGDRNLLWAATARVVPAAGEHPEAAVQRTVSELVKRSLAQMGDTGRKRCFDPDRTRALREYALAESKPAAPAPAAVPPPASVAPPEPATAADPPPAPRPATRSPRQAEWARRLASRGRVVVEDVSFAGRTAELARDAGLADLAQAMAAVPDVRIRVEGFVDSTAEPSADARLSAAMAQAAARRLVQLGVEQKRVTFAGRGGGSPVLPNFTARGRAANRRIEVVGLR